MYWDLYPGWARRPATGLRQPISCFVGVSAATRPALASDVGISIQDVMSVQASDAQPVKYYAAGDHPTVLDLEHPTVLDLGELPLTPTC